MFAGSSRLTMSVTIQLQAFVLESNRRHESFHGFTLNYFSDLLVLKLSMQAVPLRCEVARVLMLIFP